MTPVEVDLTLPGVDGARIASHIVGAGGLVIVLENGATIETSAEEVTYEIEKRK